MPAVVAVVLIVLAVVGVRALAGRFQPLATGAFELPVGQAVNDPEPSDGITPYRVFWAEGQVITYGISVRNTGPVDVRIDGVRPPRLVGGATAEVTRVRVADIASPEFSPRDGKAFKPFELENDSERFLLVDLKLTGCKSVTKSPRMTTLPVRWSAFGMSGTTDVPLDMIIELRPARGCPAAKPAK